MELEAQFFYQEACDVWKNFCELHQELFTLSCKEQELLLQSNIDELESCITEKQELISQVALEEKKRERLINKMNNQLNAKIQKAIDLVNFFQAIGSDDLLEKYNFLLIDIIEKIQSKNKYNKIFLNRALYSLNQIKKDFTGGPYTETYNAQGEKRLGTNLR
jgi:flagellar biosynthesis/type III secretory pathway chaperone